MLRIGGIEVTGSAEHCGGVWGEANRKHNYTKKFSNISMGEGWGTSLGIYFLNISLNSESSSDASNTHHNFVS